MRFGCLLSPLLITLSFAIMGFFMLPLIFEGNETVYAMLTAVLCGPGETFMTDFSTISDLRGTVRGGQVYCVAENGQSTEVTLKTFLYAGGGFLVTFLVGLVIGMRALSKAAVNSVGGLSRSGVTVRVGGRQADADSADVSALLRQFGIDNSGGKHVENRSGKSLNERLQDLQAAYDNRLITREEYDRLRQEVLDNATRLS